MSQPKAGDILADALELPPEAREGFVERACAGDAALLAEVRSLLAAHQQADELLPSDWLTRVAPRVEPALAQVSPEREVGRRLGAYRLTRVLGTGGMGAVYLADRSDAEFAKQVAIKLVRPGMGTDDLLRRFVTERQVLANLEHPNIARLLDGGATDDGLPYIVMEYVDGIPIDRHADERRLSVPDRLRLFIQVCDAVAFAHRNLVVHRDLKPGNILVDGLGAPKLLDFGIAKILDTGGNGSATALTHEHTRLLTPEYASPEQVRGEVVTTATDVYSLGVLLYELLTGRRPYRIQSRSPIDLEKTICQTEPPRPSTVVTERRDADGVEGEMTDHRAMAEARATQPGRLRRQISGDLDNIVLMALRKEPERRYASVERLADDIRRHLDGLPVSARQDSWRYRAAKFVARNRLAVGAAAVIFVILATFGVVMSIQADRLARERDRARREAETSGRVSAFLTDLFELSAPERARGDSVTAREILDAGRVKIQQGLEDEPEVRAELLRTMGNTYWSLSAYQSACTLLTEAVAIQTKLYGPGGNERLGRTMMDLAVAERGAGETDSSRAHYQRSFQMLSAALPADHLDMALFHNNYGTVLFDVGDYPAAKKEFEQAIQIWESHKADNEEIVSALRSLLHVAVQDRDFAAAEAHGKRAVELSEERYGEDHPETIQGYSSLALAFSSGGKPEEAIPLLEKALTLSERVYGPEHTRTAHVINALGGAYLTAGNKERAREMYTRALAMRQVANGPRHISVANPMYQLASIEGDLGETKAALAHFREAESILEDAGGPNQPNLPFILVKHGRLLTKLGRYAEAEALYLRANRIWEPMAGPSHPRMVGVLLARGDLEHARQRPRAADSLYASALRICTDSLPPDHKDAVETRKAYARFLRETGDAASAAALEKQVPPTE